MFAPVGASLHVKTAGGGGGGALPLRTREARRGVGLSTRAIPRLLLLEAGADARAGDDEARWWAVEGGHDAVAQLLRVHAAGALETRVEPSAQSSV